MRLLIWVPLYSLGGGSRLFIKLVQSLASDSRVEKIELVIKEKTYEEVYDALKYYKKINYNKLEERQQSWLYKKGRIKSIPGTGFAKRVLRSILNFFIKRHKDENIQLQILFKELNYDVLYCFWPHFTEYHHVKKPVVCTIQDTILFEFPELLGAYYTNLERDRQYTWLNNSTRIVVSSKNTKLNINKFFEEYDNIDIIRHDAVPDLINNSDNKFKKKGISEQYFIYPANLSPHKNHYNLLSALAKIKTQISIPIVFIGGGTQVLDFKGNIFPDEFNWHQLRLIGHIKRLGLEHNRDFYALGYVADEYVMSLIKNSYALIMPSLAEGGGSYPVEEALSVGTPVLCSDIPVMREHVDNRTAKIGWFNPESPDSISNEVIKLVENYKEFKDSTLRGMDDPRPSWESIASEYIKIFAKAIKEYDED